MLGVPLSMNVEMSKESLDMYTKEDENMLQHIVDTGKSWIRSYDPILEYQISDWHTPNSPDL